MDTEQKKSLCFSYEMQLDYTEPVPRAFFTIKALPVTNARQTITDLSVLLLPEVPVSYGKDGFGNTQVYGSVDQPHRTFLYRVSGRAELGQILFEERAEEEKTHIYRHPHGLNRSGSALNSYFNTLRDGLEENPYMNALYLMRCLHRDFSYKKGVTTVNTTAEQAWCTGGGVCQDYSHIFLALCHMAGVPARYVTGIISGEGESHAWAEILYRNKWIGMDPTNDVLVARSHIKFGHGRDAQDCQLNRGILRFTGGQSQQIRVTVQEE